MSQVRIALGGTQTSAATIEIDGHDVAHCVRRLTLDAGVGETTELRLQVMATKAAEYEGEALVRLNPDFEEFLTTLGWTPPSRP